MLFRSQLPISYVSQLMFNRPTSVRTNPNALQGIVLGIPAFGGVCALSNFTACGLGSSIVNPTVQATTSFDCTNTGGVFCNPFSFYSVTSQPFGVYARDVAHSDTPYSRQLSASWQQEITGELAIEVGYVGTSGRNLPVLSNSNFATEFDPGINIGGGNFIVFP